ncbi:putative L-talarate utilization transcriptional regulator, LacI family [Candidatus Burkholderia verschuerenii]|uniref:Putative L-talarate utilization transcriptional regulator, LacI family n=1 Tax=Candidatus Burkholderia verschuerenii TaxID=242163 RepID=A0A0L0MHY5_9BURK|nr:LacI family DNA-binding transcriptional regulator [Candidatus Burkholderia verschuerenii]KND61910.1 putative L-talarate utilization transcriptional regulator, LacI family [Candidatus Burkholderia verschuerenii]
MQDASLNLQPHPTMEDVAREAKVGRMTVSRALNQPELVSTESLAAVHAAIERLGYVQNLNAGSLASNRSRIVGAVIPTIEHQFFSDTVIGLSQTLAVKGYQLLLGQSNYQAAEEQRLFDAFVGRRVDGIMLIRTSAPAALVNRIQRCGVPVIEAWDTSNDQIDMRIGFSHRDAGAAVARFLAGRGRRRLGYMGAVDVRSSQRLDGLRAGAKASGIEQPEAVMLDRPAGINDAPALLSALLERRQDVDAVFCSSDMLAAGVLFECQRRGIRVPDDLALMGFVDLPIAAATQPGITTVRVPSLRIGELAGEMLLDYLDGKSPAHPHVDLGFSIAERSTT